MPAYEVVTAVRKYGPLLEKVDLLMSNISRGDMNQVMEVFWEGKKPDCDAIREVIRDAACMHTVHPTMRLTHNHTRCAKKLDLLAIKNSELIDALDFIDMTRRAFDKPTPEDEETEEA